MQSRIANKVLFVFPIIIILLTAFLFIYPFKSVFTSADKGRMKIVATIYPYYLITKEIVGRNQDVSVLLPPQASPHTYSPSPANIKELNNADLIISNGLFLEANLTNVLNSVKDKTFFASSVVNLDGYTDAIEYPAKDGSPDEHLAGKNPHIWLDPIFVIDIANGIKDNVILLKPAYKSIYETNCTRFISDLKNLDEKIKKERAEYKEANIITFHNAFYYFLKRYNIRLVDVIEPSPGKEPTPKQLVELGNKIKEHRITALFKEPQLNPHSAEVLANEYNLQILTLDPEGKFLNSSTFIEIIDKNWEIMKKGFTK